MPVWYPGYTHLAPTVPVYRTSNTRAAGMAHWAQNRNRIVSPSMPQYVVNVLGRVLPHVHSASSVCGKGQKCEKHKRLNIQEQFPGDSCLPGSSPCPPCREFPKLTQARLCLSSTFGRGRITPYGRRPLRLALMTRKTGPSARGPCFYCLSQMTLIERQPAPPTREGGAGWRESKAQTGISLPVWEMPVWGN